MNSRLLVWQKTGEHIGKDAPHRRAVCTRDDAYPGASSTAQHASELLQPEVRIRKELQAKLADHGIKGAIWEWQRLSVRSYRQKGQLIQSTACPFEHSRGDINANQASRRTDGWHYGDCRFP